MPGRADGEVLDAIAVEITRGDDHPPVELAGLGSRPVSQLFPSGAGTDPQLARERPRLILCRRRRDHDLALAVAVEIPGHRHDPPEAAATIGSLPVVELFTGGRREDPGPADHRIPCERCADGEVGTTVAVEVVEPGDVPSEGTAVF